MPPTDDRQETGDATVPVAPRADGTAPAAPEPTCDLATLPPSAVPAGPPIFDWVNVPGYEVLEELGRGGMGVVYKARQIKLRRNVALKMILAGGHAGAADLARFRTEAEAIARLQHPNIVAVHELGEHDGLPFFSLELCSGGNLEKRLAGTPMPPADAARLVQALARGIHAAHGHGIVHRDLKPANVLFDDQGTPKITDFGLAKKLDEAGTTQTGAIMGTPSYMAPEQAEGKKEVGPLADVYALGAILYACLTGRPPFRAATHVETVMQVLSDEPVPPRRLNPQVPVDLETVCLKCLEKAPARRYVSAADLADDLGRFLGGETIQARPARALERAVKWARRRPTAAALAGVSLAAAVALLVMGALFTLRLGKARQRAERARARAVQQLERSEGLRYAMGIGLAQRELESGKLGRAEAVLEGTNPELRGWEYRYLAAQCREQKRALLEGPSLARALSFSPDGGLLAVGCANSQIKLWDVRARALLRTFSGHTDSVSAVCFSPDGKRLASAGRDKTVRLWDVSTGRQERVLGDQPDTDHTDVVWAVGFSPDGKRLASASEDWLAKLWDVESGQLLHDLKGHTAPVRGVCFSPNGRWLATGGEDKTVRTWDTRTGKEKEGPVQKHGTAVVGVACSRDGRLASACKSGEVRVWEWRTGKVLFSLPKGERSVGLRGVCFSPDVEGKWLAGAWGNGTVAVWAPAGGQTGPVFQARVKGGGGCACFRPPDGRRLAVGGPEGVVQVWDRAAGREVFALEEAHARAVRKTAEPPPGLRQITCVCFSPDSQRLAVAEEEDVRLTGRLGKGPERHLGRGAGGHTGKVWRACFSPDGRNLASAGEDGVVRIWDAATGQEAHALRGHSGTVFSVCYSPDGQRLASAGKDGTVRLWGADGRQLQALSGHTGWVNCVCFSPDGRFLASGGEDRTVRLWDGRTGAPVRALSGHTGGVFDVCFSPDGRLASAGGDQAARLWAPDKGALLHTFLSTSKIFCLSFSPDSRRLATGNREGVVQVWETHGGLEVLTVKQHRGEVWSVCFSPNGRALASSSRVVRVWDAGPAGD